MKKDWNDEQLEKEALEPATLQQEEEGKGVSNSFFIFFFLFLEIIFCIGEQVSFFVVAVFLFFWKLCFA